LRRGEEKSDEPALGRFVPAINTINYSLQIVYFHLVPKKGLEPPHPCEYMDLNHARLPIPPLRPVFQGLAGRQKINGSPYSYKDRRCCQHFTVDNSLIQNSRLLRWRDLQSSSARVFLDFIPMRNVDTIHTRKNRTTQNERLSV
jgi:hypothetical protein